MMNKKRSPRFRSVKYLLVLPLTAVLLLSNSTIQANSPLVEEIKGVEKVILQDDDVLNSVEEMPNFVGGDKAVHKFIQDNLKYPASARKEGVERRVTIRFIVRKTGEVTDVTLLKGIEEGCDEEAMRVVRMMPNWTPGKEKGVAKNVYFTLPIVFRLNKDTEKVNMTSLISN